MLKKFFFKYFIDNNLLGVFYALIFVLGLIGFVLVVIWPILLIMFGTPSPGGGSGEICDPRFFASINPC
jgi:hypothetical protein